MQRQLIQITDPTHKWFPCIGVIEEDKDFGAMVGVFVPENTEGACGVAYIRLTFDEFEVITNNEAIYWS